MSSIEIPFGTDYGGPTVKYEIRRQALAADVTASLYFPSRGEYLIFAIKNVVSFDGRLLWQVRKNLERTDVVHNTLETALSLAVECSRDNSLVMREQVISDISKTDLTYVEVVQTLDAFGRSLSDRPTMDLHVQAVDQALKHVALKNLQTFYRVAFHVLPMEAVETACNECVVKHVLRS